MTGALRYGIFPSLPIRTGAKAITAQGVFTAPGLSVAWRKAENADSFF